MTPSESSAGSVLSNRELVKRLSMTFGQDRPEFGFRITPSSSPLVLTYFVNWSADGAPQVRAAWSIQPGNMFDQGGEAKNDAPPTTPSKTEKRSGKKAEPLVFAVVILVLGVLLMYLLFNSDFEKGTVNWWRVGTLSLLVIVTAVEPLRVAARNLLKGIATIIGGIVMFWLMMNFLVPAFFPRLLPGRVQTAAPVATEVKAPVGPAPGRR